MLALLLTTITVGTLSSFSPNYPAFLVGNIPPGVTVHQPLSFQEFFSVGFPAWGTEL